MHSRYSLLAGLVSLLGLSAAAEDTPTINAPDQWESKSDDKAFEQAKLFMRKMQEGLAKAIKSRELAKKNKDLVKLNCINEKIVLSTSNVHDAEQAMAALSDAIVRGDRADRQHEFTRIRIFYQKVLILGAESENCAGEENNYVGPSQIEVDVDPTIPHGDPTDPGLPKPYFAAPPPGVEVALIDTPTVNPMVMP